MKSNALTVIQEAREVVNSRFSYYNSIMGKRVELTAEEMVNKLKNKIRDIIDTYECIGSNSSEMKEEIEEAKQLLEKI